jgi:hypothetical protein
MLLMPCRHPKPVVRPEWIVDSLKAHKVLPVGAAHSGKRTSCLMSHACALETPCNVGLGDILALPLQHEGYVLQRLRAQPGQKLLAGYQPASGSGSFTKDSLYPQTKVQNDDPGKAADLALQPPVTVSRPAADPEKPTVPEPRATPEAVAAAAPVVEPDAQPSGAVHAFGAVQPGIDGSKTGVLPTESGANPAEQPPSTHQALTPETHKLDAEFSAPPADQSNDGFELSLQLPADEECAAALQRPPGPSAAVAAAVACKPSLQQQQQPAFADPQCSKRLPRAEEAPPLLVADDTDLAQQVHFHGT